MKASILVLALLATTAAAAQGHRELGAHEHGHGKLNIAFEGDQVAMELEVPGADIVGFEHAAETAEHRAAVEDAVAQLARPTDLFAFPEDAGCRVIEAGVELHGEEAHDGEHGHEAHAGDEHGDRAHSEFHAEYMLACADIEAVTAIEFPYFEIFRDAEELDVQMIGATGATSATVERDAPRIDLSQTM